MLKKTVTIEIEIPVTYGYNPAEETTFDHPGALAEVCDIDFDIAEAEAKIWERLESPGVIAILHEHAEAQQKEAKNDAKIIAWEDRNGY